MNLYNLDGRTLKGIGHCQASTTAKVPHGPRISVTARVEGKKPLATSFNLEGDFDTAYQKAVKALCEYYRLPTYGDEFEKLVETKREYLRKYGLQVRWVTPVPYQTVYTESTC